MRNILILAAALSGLSGAVHAKDLSVDMYKATPEGRGAKAGTVAIKSTTSGAAFSVKLEGMEPGSEHGFHVHANGSCAPLERDGKLVPALAAGGHWDPQKTGFHAGAGGDGHLGDLPRIDADENGNIRLTVTAPRIKDISALKGHALMVHLHGDNYSDSPKKLGGGGARLFCGVIK